MNNKDFQYRETYFIVGNPATLWILILGLVSFGTRSNRSSYGLWWDCRGGYTGSIKLAGSHFVWE
ncbi:hypothetical protein BJP51_21155 [Paenibacillus odorifer]|uniref:Uncharacterized protein n=1 Tax=Paenibacillus odorifer TaxID=189426 RepID=A0A1R0X698_9BACL|nr:hypothetical protein BJP51_21155 [Paenibacillus odorifer]